MRKVLGLMCLGALAGNLLSARFSSVEAARSLAGQQGAQVRQTIPSRTLRSALIPLNGAVAAHSQQDVGATESSAEKALLRRYCVGCHGGANPRAGLGLDKLDMDDVGQNA